MNNKTLGTLALIGAPAMFIGTMAESKYPQLYDSWFTGLWGLVYISAFMCTVIALKRSGILGGGKLAKAMPIVLMATLSMANIANLIWLAAAKSKPSFFMAIDLCWPLSHVLMLVVGVLVIKAKKVVGWQRYAPFLMGTWFPVAMLLLNILGFTQAGFLAGGLYNVLVVALLAWAARNLPDKNAQTGMPKSAAFLPVLP